MKKITALFLAILCSLVATISRAEVITADIAKETADIFLSLDNEWNSATDANIKLVEKEGVPAYYIIQYTTGGWAIVSAQSSSSPIIGYNTTGEFATPAPVSELLDFNANLITARTKDLENIEHAGWRRVRQRKAAAEVINTPDIAPLIKINLNQSEPFNKYCPQIDGQNTLVGCVAVGMTQAIMVQGYPQRPSGSYSYTCENTGTHSIDYDAQPAYDWNAINNCETTGNYDEVARLLYHAGVSVDMQYGLEGSGSQTDYVAEALIRNFGYDSKIVYTTAKHPDNTKWLELIINELAHGRVVVYGGTGEEGGHCWNIDGWKQSTQMVHCNWGWSGYGNGYFSLDNLVDSYQGISFLYNHRAVFGVAALTAAPYDILLHSTQFAIDTEVGTTLSYVEVLSTDNNATYSYELFGLNGTQSPYQISNNKLTSTERVTDSDKFKYVRIKASNSTTGQSYEKEFYIQIISANTHKLIGSYKAFANSAFKDYPDEEWDITITTDKSDASKLWIQPVCIFGGLSPTNITALYATYNEATSTLTLPIGQKLYETPDYQMITGISRDNRTIETTGDITLQITSNDKGIVISFPTDIVFGVGNALDNEWWYQVLENITFTKQQITTAPYGIELSTTTFTIDTKPNTPLADVAVLCDDKNASFNYEVYDRVGNTSPYKVVNNALVSSETIADNDTFKYLRIKATNTLTGEAYVQAFDIQIVENKATMFVGEYTAFANSAFKGYPDEEWEVSITADNSVPNKIWIQPICLFGGLEASDINPVYATYDVAKGTLTMPLGQTLFQQADKYQMIIGTSVDGNEINTTGEIELQILESESGLTISFASDYILGVGNAIGNKWWYQALYGITFTQIEKSVVEQVDISKLAGNYNAFAHSAFKDYPDEEWEVSISIDQESPNKVWIKPVCMFADLNPRYINAVYGTYDAETGIITMPLGQVLYEQDDKYRIITGASFDGGASRDTSGDILFYVTLKDENVVIEMDSNVVIGVGNAVTNQWWWQALYAMTYTKVRVYEKIEIDGIYYNITSNAKRTAQVSFKGNSLEQYSNEYTDTVVIPETITYDGTTFTVTSIEGGSFYYCTRVTSITIPGTITEIGDKAFYNCVSLSEINMGAVNPPLIYAETFMGVNKSIPVHVPDNSKSYYVSAQYWNEFTNIIDNAAPIESGKIEVNGIFYNITEASTAEVTYKGNSYDEYSNEYSGEVIIPETITYDGSTYTVTSIEEYSFYFCTGITYISIPATITEIGNNAFCYCVSITELNVNAEEPPVIYAETFLGVDKTLPLYVPDNSIDKYRNADYWCEFTNLKVYSSIDTSEVNDMEIVVHNGTITLIGVADGAVVNIFSMQGMLMHRTTAGNIGNITLPRGVYILQVEGNRYKIAI